MMRGRSDVVPEGNMHRRFWSRLMGLVGFVAPVLFLSTPADAHAEDVKGFKLDGERFTVADGSLAFRGILVKPPGKGPFPALLISHGLGGNAEQFGRQKARDFVAMGFVC